MSTLEQVMNTGESATNPMQGFTSTVLELTETVQEAMHLLTAEAQKLSSHEHIMADADKPGHFMMGLGFEYDAKTKRHNVVGSFSFNEEMRKLEERISAELGKKANTTSIELAFAQNSTAHADIAANLAQKADIATMNSELGKKSNAAAVTAELAQKANLAKTESASIGTTWQGASPPYTQTVSVTGVTASSIVEVTLPASATQAHLDAFRALNWTDGGQVAGQITLKAWGTKNTETIPVTVIVRG